MTRIDRVAPAGGVPFFGRERMLDACHRDLADGRHLLLTGESGIGKTRLARELLASTDSVDRVFANPTTQHIRLGALSVLSTPPDATSTDLGAIFQWHLHRWRRRGDRPVLWVDDIQHLDDASATVVRAAVTHGIVRLVATARTRQPLPLDIQALVVEGVLETRAVPPLTASASVRLAKAAARRPIDDDEALAIHRSAAGNPLFVTALASSRDPATPTPDRRVDLGVIGRALTAQPNDALDCAALIAAAEPVPLWLLRTQEEHIERLVDDGILVVDDAAVRTAHPLIGEWLRTHHGVDHTIFAGLAGEADQRPHLVDPVVHATWWLRADALPPAALAERASRAALGRLDVDNARRFAPHAGGASELLLARSALGAGHWNDAVRRLEGVMSGSATASHRVEAAAELARHYGLTLADAPAADRTLAAVDDADLPLADRRRLHIARSWLWIFTDGAERPDLSESVRLITAPPVDADAFELAVDTAAIAAHIGNLTTTSSCLRHADTLLDQLGSEITGASLSRRSAVSAQHLALQGRFGDAVGQLAADVDAADRDGRLVDVALLAGNLGFYASCSGSLEAGRAAAERARRAARPNDWYRYGDIAAIVTSGIDAIAGRRRQLDPADVERARSTNMIESMLGVRVVLNAEDADADTRACVADDALGRLLRHGHTSHAALTYLEGADLTLGRRVHDLIVDHDCGEDATDLAAAAWAAARHRRRGDGSGLLPIAAACESMPFPLAAARMYRDAVRLHRTPGEALAGRRGLTRCRHAVDGHRIAFAADVAGLPSVREVEVAQLVLELDSTVEAAKRLHLSRRTVENHVYRCGQALGATGRDEIAEALAVPGARSNDSHGFE